MELLYPKKIYLLGLLNEFKIFLNNFTGQLSVLYSRGTTLSLHSPHLCVTREFKLIVLQTNYCRFPQLKHILYDNTNKEKIQTHHAIRPVSDLVELGATVSDTQLRQARDAVRPDDPVMHFFSSVSKQPILLWSFGSTVIICCNFGLCWL